MDRITLARAIDHTCLKPEATEADIARLCDEAARNAFATVCVNPCWVALAARRLAGAPVAVCAVVGFPLGATTPAIKAAEAAEVVRAGAREVDMVLNVGRLRGGDERYVQAEIAGVRHAIGDGPILKVIIEAALLTPEEKRAATRLVVQGGADFVKTSTGMNAAGGATVDDVRLLALVAGPHVGVKAAGGIRTTEAALAMLAAGARRIGTSSGVSILDGLHGEVRPHAA